MAFKIAKTVGGTAAAMATYAAMRAGQRLLAPELAGQVALITGGSRGLGFLIAQELAAQGCKVCICARDKAELDRAENELRMLGADVLALVCDISDQVQAAELVRLTTQHFGSIDILVNNAGIIQVGPLEAMTYRDFEHAMNVIYLGAVYSTLAVLPQMRARRRGRIVNITSIGGKVAVPHLLPYDAAKFATVGFSEGLRAELKKDNILVTTIIPGLMRTGSPMNAWFKGDTAREYAWFSIGDAQPLTAMNARRAARRIVLAARRGEAEVVLSWQAKLLRFAHAAFPVLTMELLGAVNRALPSAEGETPLERGADVAARTPTTSRIGAMLDHAAEEYNEYGAESPEP